MSDISKAPENQPGLIMGVASCVCAVLGFLVPVIGVLLAIAGLVLGIKAYSAAKRLNYQTGLILGLIGALVSGVSLIYSAIATLAVLSVVAGLGLFSSMR